MRSIRQSPLTMKGSLHDVLLFNFSVDPDPLAGMIPAPLELDLVGDRAIISVVSVQLKRMRPALVPVPFGFGYHHIAYRVLVRDPLTGQHGIYFLTSLADSPLLCWLGNYLSEYEFHSANIEINTKENLRRVTASARHADQNGIAVDLEADLALGSDIPKDSVFQSLEEAHHIIGRLDQAFSVDHKRGTISRVQVKRRHWPIVPVWGRIHHAPFFGILAEPFAWVPTVYTPKTARFEIAFRTTEPVQYVWQRAEVYKWKETKEPRIAGAHR